MEWIVRLAGNSDVLEDLSKACNVEDLVIEREVDYYIMKSASFAPMEESEAVLKKAEKFLALINGAAALMLGLRDPLKAEHVIKIDAEGKKHIFVFLEEAVSLSSGTMKMTVTTADGNTYEVNEAAPIPAWISIAQNDESVAKVLRLLGENKYEWPSNFYRIFEIVKNDAGDLSGKGWVTNEAVKRFKRTVHSPEITGDIARHGIQKEDAPTNPMSHAEARAFITTIVIEWITAKLR